MSVKLGLLYAGLTFGIIGVYPLYLKQLQHVPPLQITLHRVLWSFVTILPLFLWRRTWSEFRATALTASNLRVCLVSATAMAGQWILYVWAVSANYIVETSLGYFINPVFSVLLAVFVLKEVLRRWQVASVALAAAGVLVVAIAYGKFPWLALTIASFVSLYALAKKKCTVPAIDSVVIELGYLVLPTVVALVVLEATGHGVFFRSDSPTKWLLVGTGVTTAVPLLLFASAARLISLTLLGFMQYIGPILTFLVGVLVYQEPFSTAKLVGFVLVWIALVLFAVEGALVSKKPSNEPQRDGVSVHVEMLTPLDAVGTSGPRTPSSQ
ncbi:Aste57867_1732 [Aphanomyces stellatus]|uniref:Aste57867_1732 protein n=1 Tax=Aphanomyces stellatus TaxID=120398 RepID=A0A485K8J7_9STRA|nr:hypothetical protein As57867_001730 [Aphanomyces stellatus]VFT78943.1 Aste57867_1732 [Aphanomyces stellatus]